ncbi:MAG TPA: hypothetical protein VFG06_10935, partial [Thermodesulfovibrionales bacterium]|nr:hypothetical protein [Thermodesulfovibrionales bacterium]
LFMKIFREREWYFEYQYKRQCDRYAEGNKKTLEAEGPLRSRIASLEEGLLIANFYTLTAIFLRLFDINSHP